MTGAVTCDVEVLGVQYPSLFRFKLFVAQHAGLSQLREFDQFVGPASWRIVRFARGDVSTVKTCSRRDHASSDNGERLLNTLDRFTSKSNVTFLCPGPNVRTIVLVTTFDGSNFRDVDLVFSANDLVVSDAVRM